MANSKYYYNPETCQYERNKLTFWKAAHYISGVLVTGGLLFAALVFVVDKFVNTDLEKTLRQENKALKKHKDILTAQLSDVELLLVNLHQRESKLHEKLFDVPGSNFKEGDINEKRKLVPNHEILLSDEDVFHSKLLEVRASTERLRSKSLKGNSYFREHINLKPEDAVTLESVPTLRPIQDSSLVQLASGFGIRINPFHKGRYMHPGIDFTAPRGTLVFAAAPGKITAARLGSLQAGHGNYVIINHNNGFTTQYAHLDEIFVRYGEMVSKGQVIGTVGNSGGSIVPHLHYEIIQNGEHVDPLMFMVEGISSAQYQQMLTIGSQQNQSLD
ncbi:MAG TPA: M23 family metallopeptidase [Cyclobacteriaceae bacterium]|nr:M23 family metallopeptidase [Cyclobacteriaceae bacterium]